MTAKWYTSLLSAFFHVENKSHIENKFCALPLLNTYNCDIFTDNRHIWPPRKAREYFFEIRSRVHLIFVTQKKVNILEFLHVFLWISLVETEKIQIFEHWRQDKTLISGHIILEEWLFA